MSLTQWEEVEKLRGGGGEELEPNEISITNKPKGSRSSQNIMFSTNISRKLTKCGYKSLKFLTSGTKNMLGLQFSKEKPAGSGNNLFSIGGRDDLHRVVCVGRAVGLLPPGRYEIEWDENLMVINFNQ